MPKRTLYHPVSIYVIRGSFEDGGFNVGRLRQVYGSKDLGKAGYIAELKSCPKSFLSLSPRVQINTINNCFASDIEVTSITTSYERNSGRRRISLMIRTALYKDDDPKGTGEAQPILIPQDREKVIQENLRWLWGEETTDSSGDTIADDADRNEDESYISF